MLQDAIQAYHDLLSGDLAAESQEFLDHHQRRRGLTFGDRPMSNVLRPRFLTLRQWHLLRSRTRPLLQAFDRIHRAALADAAFRRQFGLTEWEEKLLPIESGFDCDYPTSRLDSFFTSEQELYFTEFNTETPAGAAYNDAMSDLFIDLPAMRSFTRQYQVRPLPCRSSVVRELLHAYRQCLGSRVPPRIAILDWRDVPTHTEFELYQDALRRIDFECVIADPRDVEYRGGRLMAGDFHITLIYKRVLISELIEQCGLQHPIVQAVRDRAVCMVNPFRCKILYKKASLAVLSDERNAHLFSTEQRSMIVAHIPWTRCVEERHTQWQDDEPIDLIPFVLQHRQQLVLKPNDDYGGRGIVLGWTVDDTAWHEAVVRALREPTIVQERIRLPHESYPSLVDGQVTFVDRMLDTNPFVSAGCHLEGCLTRISAEDLLNVTAGTGSAVPTFLLEEP